jgi:hypothetical protein
MVQLAPNFGERGDGGYAMISLENIDIKSRYA